MKEPEERDASTSPCRRVGGVGRDQVNDAGDALAPLRARERARDGREGDDVRCDLGAVLPPDRGLEVG